MKHELRQQSAGELVAFIHSDNIHFTGSQLGMLNRWIELLQTVVKESGEALEKENPEKKTQKLSEVTK